MNKEIFQSIIFIMLVIMYLVFTYRASNRILLGNRLNSAFTLSLLIIHLSLADLPTILLTIYVFLLVMSMLTMRRQLELIKNLKMLYDIDKIDFIKFAKEEGLNKDYKDFRKLVRRFDSEDDNYL